MLDALPPARAVDRRPAPARRVPLPRTWGVRPVDVVALLVGNGVLIGLMWVRHGGLAELATPGGPFTAAGQLAGLYGAYLVLIQLVLMSRSPWLDQAFGTDRLAWAHRWVGFTCTWMLLGHGLLVTVGYAQGAGRTVVDQALTLVGTYPFVLWSVAAMALFVLVAATSVRAARRRMAYETWFNIHLYAYLAVALAFMHQLVTGIDFIDDPIARLYWIGLYASAVGLILAFRFGLPLRITLRHRFSVASVVPEARGVVSLYVTGRQLDRLPVRAGQWFNVRILNREGWWRHHPLSISAAPNGRFLRFTVKDLGDWSGSLRHVAPGTPIMLEGPYGILTGARRTHAKVLLVAGGVGITPLRALLEALPAKPGDLTLLYRARRPEEVVFREELDRIAAARGATVHYLLGARGSRAMPHDPFDPDRLASLVPDAAERDVYVCGPSAMMDGSTRGLRAMGVPPAQIHLERFSY